MDLLKYLVQYRIDLRGNNFIKIGKINKIKDEESYKACFHLL